MQVARACRDAGTPYVVSLRGMLDDWAMRQKPLKKQLYLALGGRRFLEGAAAVHCTAEYEKQQSRKRFGTAKAAVIPNLVDLRPYAEAPDPGEARAEWPGITGDGLTVLFLSRLHPGKGVDMLIDAVAEVRRRGGGVHLVIAGNGEEDYEKVQGENEQLRKDMVLMSAEYEQLMRVGPGSAAASPVAPSPAQTAHHVDPQESRETPTQDEVSSVAGESDAQPSTVIGAEEEQPYDGADAVDISDVDSEPAPPVPKPASRKMRPPPPSRPPGNWPRFATAWPR